MRFPITGEWEGRTVKQFLYTRLHFSTAQVTRLKKLSDGILLNGARVTVRASLRAGDELSLRIEPSPEEIPPAGTVPGEQAVAVLPAESPPPLSILLEDDALLAVDKPPYMPTHPSRGHLRDSLASALACRFACRQTEETLPFCFRAVNRLDRDTSGIVLTAKTGLAAAILSRAMSERRIEKEYIAFLSGILQVPPCTGVIEGGIRRVREGSIRREVCKADEGAYARTEYTVLFTVQGADAPPFTAVLARPRTGRTHQLRVHFASIGYPILGDTLYGEADLRIARQALHAVFLRFPHPMTEEETVLRAPLPEDMKKLLPEGVLPEDLLP